MEKRNTIEKVRAFHRFYMPFMNLLGDHYLGSEYSITEARCFFEIYEHEGCNAAYLSQVMNIDKGYMSRIIKAHEKNGYVSREPSLADRRSYELSLTAKGRQKAEKFIKAANEEIAGVLCGLSERDEQRLTDAMDTIMKILSKERGGNEDEDCSLRA